MIVYHCQALPLQWGSISTVWVTRFHGYVVINNFQIICIIDISEIPSTVQMIALHALCNMHLTLLKSDRLSAYWCLVSTGPRNVNRTPSSWSSDWKPQWVTPQIAANLHKLLFAFMRCDWILSKKICNKSLCLFCLSCHLWTKSAISSLHMVWSSLANRLSTLLSPLHCIGWQMAQIGCW